MRPTPTRRPEWRRPGPDRSSAADGEWPCTGTCNSPVTGGKNDETRTVVCGDRVVGWRLQRRVHAVRQALIAKGVMPSRISAGTFGAREPVCRDTTDACLALNRRVEVLAARP